MCIGQACRSMGEGGGEGYTWPLFKLLEVGASSPAHRESETGIVSDPSTECGGVSSRCVVEASSDVIGAGHSFDDRSVSSDCRVLD